MTDVQGYIYNAYIKSIYTTRREASVACVCTTYILTKFKYFMSADWFMIDSPLMPVEPPIFYEPLLANHAAILLQSHSVD